jgi:hypothetical protein
MMAYRTAKWRARGGQSSIISVRWRAQIAARGSCIESSGIRQDAKRKLDKNEYTQRYIVEMKRAKLAGISSQGSTEKDLGSWQS